MFSPSKSTPKMRRAMTPRVRSSNNLQQAYINKAHNFTSQKNNKNNHNHQNINPQKVEEHLNKKLNLNYLNGNNDKKNNFQMLHTAISVNQKPSIIHSHQNLIHKDPKIIGRDIQWNANNKQNKQNNNINKQNQQKKQQSKNKARAMSAHTIRSNNDIKKNNNFNQKSSKIKQQKKQFQQKFDIAFNYLIGQNYEYLGQKLSMCNQKSRPLEKSVKMSRAKGLTVYQNDYTKKLGKKGEMYKLQIQPQNQKTALFISPSKIYDKSKQHQIHNDKVKQGKKADLATWPQGFRLQGPTYSVTTNQNAYPHHGQYQKMVPIATFNQHPLGMPHKGTSTHRDFFKGQFTPRANLATWDNLHPYGNQFNPNRGTQYENTHGNKQIQQIQQWPHPEHKLTNVQTRTFSTQIQDNFKNFTDHWLNSQNRCKCGRKRH